MCLGTTVVGGGYVQCDSLDAHVWFVLNAAWAWSNKKCQQKK